LKREEQTPCRLANGMRDDETSDFIMTAVFGVETKDQY
jgi:hypothetical protein